MLAAELLRSLPEVDADKIVIIGHSLGATLIPRIAARDSKLAGVVAMAPLGRTLPDTMVDQFTYLFNLDGEVSPQEQAKLDEVKAARQRILGFTEADAGTDQSVLGAHPSYWLDLRGFEPHRAAQNVECPLLVLQGERDYQVTMVDFALWKEALDGRPRVTLKRYPGLTHLFTPGEGTPSPAEYNTAKHVDAAVIADLVRWIERL